MIPFIAKIGFRDARNRGFRLWVPLVFVWLLLLPVVLLLLPFLCIACLIAKVDPFRAFLAFWQIITNLKGTDVEVGVGSASLSIDII